MKNSLEYDTTGMAAQQYTIDQESIDGQHGFRAYTGGIDTGWAREEDRRLESNAGQKERTKW